jgi:hypothetical protein
MKAFVMVEKEVEIKEVIIDIRPRHIGDGEGYDMPTGFPLLNDAKNRWVARVNIDTGVIAGWPQGDARKMHVKVCDAGTYRLIDASGGEIAAIVNYYVPHGVVPGSYGDYVELTIDESGRITNWPRRPDFSAFFKNGDD